MGWEDMKIVEEEEVAEEEGYNLQGAEEGLKEKEERECVVDSKGRGGETSRK